MGRRYDEATRLGNDTIRPHPRHGRRLDAAQESRRRF